MKTRRKQTLTRVHGVNTRHGYSTMRERRKTTYVCFDCRTSRRDHDRNKVVTDESGARSMEYHGPNCHECGKEMTGVGWRWRIPCRTQVKAWKLMQNFMDWKSKKGRKRAKRDWPVNYGQKRPKGVRVQRLF